MYTVCVCACVVNGYIRLCDVLKSDRWQTIWFMIGLMHSLSNTHTHTHVSADAAVCFQAQVVFCCGSSHFSDSFCQTDSSCSVSLQLIRVGRAGRAGRPVTTRSLDQIPVKSRAWATCQPSRLLLASFIRTGKWNREMPTTCCRKSFLSRIQCAT